MINPQHQLEGSGTSTNFNVTQLRLTTLVEDSNLAPASMLPNGCWTRRLLSTHGTQSCMTVRTVLYSETRGGHFRPRGCRLRNAAAAVASGACLPGSDLEGLGNQCNNLLTKRSWISRLILGGPIRPTGGRGNLPKGFARVPTRASLRQRQERPAIGQECLSNETLAAIAASIKFPRAINACAKGISHNREFLGFSTPNDVFLLGKRKEVTPSCIAFAVITLSLSDPFRVGNPRGNSLVLTFAAKRVSSPPPALSCKLWHEVSRLDLHTTLRGPGSSGLVSKASAVEALCLRASRQCWNSFRVLH